MSENFDLGERLSAESQWLSLLFCHLASPSVLRHVERDDLVQEVFLRVVKSPDSVPDPRAGGEELRRYLAAIARHTVIDVVRALRARKRSGNEIELDRSSWSQQGMTASGLAAHEPGPATRVERNEESDRLLEAFLRLSGEHRRVLGFRQFEGLSAEETGQRMGRSASAVHSMYRRALAAWAEVEERR
ncbi:MAG: RNA polymerase sigma factor [Planctomycetota bacterium]